MNYASDVPVNKPVDTRELILFVLFILMLNSLAVAATVPASGSFLYDMYDLVIVKGIGGAAGYVIGATGVGIGLARMGFGASPLATIGTLIGSGGFLAAPTIVTSMGAIY